ncbi:hypothetical protein Sste5346_009082 [Sporothrix stenoceras]|uniref:Zn(2)-C6 fungal-type domain-containing protein n=1 Tax=Sporothrix stenoceras TaxID=5173 RepID=A0ABR3YLA6_9PEZI
MQPTKRARQACIACNARRVKCNVTESMPCRNCLADGQRCEVRESRRGKHPRRRLDGTPAKPAKPVRVSTSISSSTRQGDEVAASEALVTLLRDNNNNNNNNNNNTDRRTSFDDTTVYDDPKSISPGTIPVQHATASTETEAEAYSVFLGESNTLRYVQADAADGDASPPDDTSPGSTVHLLHQVPGDDTPVAEGKVQNGDSKMADGSDNIPPWAAERRRIQMQFLQLAGALTFPPADTIDSLLDAYFRWFHPCYAVVDEADTRQKQKAGTLSPLLLQAMLFIGAIHAGGGDDGDDFQRQKYTYYNRCKDLYDADYERDKVTIIQSVFLMSFWRSGPFLEKDTRHWLATAISLTQSKAMHRSAVRVARTSTAASTGSPAARQLRQLKQRLWWCIYTREQQCAAALGLPSRISDDDCDVAMLQPRDFEFAFDSQTSTNHEGVAFQVGATGLARILVTIIRHGYAPGKSLTTACKATIRKELRAWKPPSLDAHLDDEGGAASTFYTRLLHLSYNNLLILIYRPAYINHHAASGKEKDARTDEEGRIALDAAARNSRIVEDLVAAPSLLASLRHAPVHVITNLFNTLCMHTIHLRRLATQGRQKTSMAGMGIAEGALTIAEHRAKVCLLGLQELQRTWDVRNWILQLFFQYLDRSTAARLSVDEGSLKGDNISSTMDQAARVAMPTTAPPTEHMPLFTGIAGIDSNLALAYTDPPGETDLLFSSPWTVPTLEEQQIYLFSQMETDNLALGEGGGLCGYWGPSDNNLSLAPTVGVDSMTDFLGRV